MTDMWGVGNRRDEKAFDTTMVGNQKVDLIFGEHPHSRSDNNMYARWPDGTVEGFDGHRLIHEIKFRDFNYLKESWLSGNEVRKSGQCEIWINGFIVDCFSYREIEWALLEAHRKLPLIHGHPVRLWDEKERLNIIGRKVYYRNVPAIITDLFEDQGCVGMKPDGCEFPPAPYELEDIKEGTCGDSEYKDFVKDSIHSPHIWWWRED